MCSSAGPRNQHLANFQITSVSPVLSFELEPKDRPSLTPGFRCKAKKQTLAKPASANLGMLKRQIVGKAQLMESRKRNQMREERTHSLQVQQVMWHRSLA